MLRKLGVIAALFMLTWDAFAQPGAAEVDVTEPEPLRNVNLIQPFGSELFTGEFAKQSFSGFNPNYVLNVGDRIAFQMWGGFDLSTVLTVDPQGNVFIPKVGPVNVLGVENRELNNHLLKQIKRVFKSNVNTYASLETAQPVKIYVTGQVRKPGLYAGLNSDSLLFYIDSARGINPDTGSYIDIQVKRNGKVVQQVNLYEFLLEGEISQKQLMDGDVILVGERKDTVTVRGELERSAVVEFDGKIAARDLIRLVRPKAKASHIRVTHQSEQQIQSEYLAFEELDGYSLTGGDQVEIVADKRFQSISVRIQGEHAGAQEIILPYGATLDKAIETIEYNAISNPEGIQLFRLSVQERQREMIMNSLVALEETVLTARSGTAEEANLRATEAKNILQWIEKAKNIEPKGQIVLAEGAQMSSIALEDGDIINIPKKTGLVMVHGEVMFPSALSYSSDASVADYIAKTGGYSRRNDVSKILIMHPNGEFSELSIKKAKKVKLAANDEILVLPKVDFKTMQVTKDITGVIYEIAIAAGVLLAL